MATPACAILPRPRHSTGVSPQVSPCRVAEQGSATARAAPATASLLHEIACTALQPALTLSLCTSGLHTLRHAAVLPLRHLRSRWDRQRSHLLRCDRIVRHAARGTLCSLGAPGHCPVLGVPLAPARGAAHLPKTRSHRTHGARSMRQDFLPLPSGLQLRPGKGAVLTLLRKQCRGGRRDHTWRPLRRRVAQSCSSARGAGSKSLSPSCPGTPSLLTRSGATSTSNSSRTPTG